MILADNLRKSVVQAAMQGKLTKQLPSDSSVDDLITRIKNEKELLVNKKNARKDPVFKKIEESEIEFEIPNNWRWIRLGEIGIYKKGPFGSSLTKSKFISKSETAIKVYEQKNAIQKDATLGEYYISSEYYYEKMYGFTVEPGDIIVSCAGTIGETYVMPENIEKGIINQALMRMNIVESINLKYFLIYFDHVLKKNAKKSSNGSAIKNIPPFEIFKNMIFPIPPIEEQQRIVEKLDLLMKEIDEYKVMEKQLEEIKKKFPNDMKMAVLQYAMQGKLTKQLPSDSSVDELLNDIKRKKAKLIKDNKLKKEKILLSIEDDNKPFEIPNQWKWIRLGDISSLVTKGTTPRGGNAAYSNEGVKFLRAENVSGLDYIDMSNIKYVDEKTHSGYLKRSILQECDILITIAGTLGRTSLVKKEHLPLNCNQAISIVRLVDAASINLMYLIYAINAPFIINSLIEQKRVTAIPNLTLEIISNYMIPLPPIEEQQRIVEKLEQILPLLDELN